MRPMGCLGAIALCLARLCIAQDSTATPAANISTHTVIVRARSLIDGTSARPLRDPEIVIRGNRIVDVYVAGTHPPPSGAQVIDLGAATVLPGLIDCHTHIFLQGEVPAAGGYDVQLLKFPASYRVARAIVAARRALEQGFTTIRDVGAPEFVDVALRNAIDDGTVVGPRMLVATLTVGATGGHGDLVGFSARAGGAVCRLHTRGSFPLSPAGLIGIEQLLSIPLADAVGAGLGERARREALAVVTSSYEEHGGFRLRSLSA